MKMIEGIKDVTKLKIPVNHVILEVVKPEEESTIETPDGTEIDAGNIYSKVIAAGSECKRLEVGDVVFMFQHFPIEFGVNEKGYFLTYEDNCALGTSEDNVEVDDGSKDIIV